MGPSSRHRCRFFLAVGLPSAIALTSMSSACGGEDRRDANSNELASALESPPPVQSLAIPVNLDGASWRQVAMPYDAAEPTAVGIDDSRLLISGGLDTEENATVSDAYLFDLGTETWTTLPAMGEDRWGHSATRLSDGRILVAGGAQRSETLEGYSNTSELFDPTSSQWTTIPLAVSLGRAAHTANLLPDGRVILAGGSYENGYLGAVEFFDPNAGPEGSWQAGPWFSPGRAHHTATFLPGGSLLMTGGHDSGVLSTSSVFELDLSEEGTWAQRTSLYGGRAYHTATLLHDGRVLVVGGRNGSGIALATVEMYRPPLQTLSQTAAVESAGLPITPLATPGWYFDLAEPLAIERTFHTAALLPDGRVLVVGGRSMNGVTATTEIYDPTSEIWSLGPELKFARSHHQMVMLGARVVVIGGLDGGDQPIPSVEILEFAKKLGEGCSDGAECNSGFCVDGVCCESKCEGACVTCAASLKALGDDGFCGPTAAGSNPREMCEDEGASSCGMTGTCDGQGACGVYEDGTVCGEESVCKAGHCEAPSTPPVEVCEGLPNGTPCGDDDGCSVATCQNAVCVPTHKLNGSRCEGGVCIAGECKLDRAPSPGDSDAGFGDNGGADGDASSPDPSGKPGSFASDENDDGGGGLCSAAPGSSPTTPMAFGLALLAGLGAWRRRQHCQ